MSEALGFLLAPFVACVVLILLHAYLGLHVITRGVIFVDLALAQIAALGAMVIATRGHEPGTLPTYLGSLGFAIVGAAIFSVTGSRHRCERVPQEAIIGIVYAVAASAVILFASKLSHGAQEIERMLVGNILWVRWPTIGRIAVLYAALGAFHYWLRRPFLAISSDPRGAHARGLRVRLYDFLFYASFALAITASVATAGVLLVFTFLVVPAVAGVLLADGVRRRLLVGWLTALAASILGLTASWKLDLPTGAAIVASFGVLLLVLSLLRVLFAPGSETASDAPSGAR